MRQRIEIAKLPPGLNSRGGLQRAHWSEYQNIKKTWAWLIMAEKPKKHKGKVRIHFTRVSTAPMDLDNVASSFKVIGDALEANKVIKNDSPEILTELNVSWGKAERRKQQGVIIEIEDIE